ncbi:MULTISPECIES: lipopolysaccharide biosynthesis protein [Peribacillus]|uniref:lipopolysaccharide biosynthesis protein n=1 Tax=Peribacillus TaxID=2675229 RepID=UPI001F4ECC63|nr:MULTISPECIES: oligosaccharide flippase family protein [unclassified Peribacillus]MCK1981942.1 oligosaccharide flippase family protein [Peribacillus sp. Aquil_B1]MCK2010014.1 oligosaccharide flippase family protein [Peribacillus sp. Aquil_B8]
MSKKGKQGLIKLFMSFAIGPIGAALINFLTIPVITWMVTPEEYGKTAIFILMQTLTTALIFLGMDQSFVREYNERENKRELLFISFLIPLLFSFVTAIFILFFDEELAGLLFNENNVVVIQLFALWIPFITLERFLLLNIRMQEKGLIYSYFNILSKLLIFLFTLLLLLFWAKNYTVVIAANVAGQIITDLILIFYCRKSISISYKYLNKKLINKMFRFGTPFIPTAFLMWFINSTDRIILQRYSSPSELGVYFAALKVVGVFTIFQTIFSTFWIPIAYKWENEKVDTKEFTKISHYLTCSMSIIFLLILFVKKVFVLILSTQYSDVIYIVPFLIFFPIMFTMGETTGLGIAFARKTHYNIWISIILAIVNFIINIVLVKQYDAVGASIAIGITYILYFWIRTLVSRRVWYKFKLKFYAIHTIILIIASTLNLLITSNIIYIINIIFLFLLIIYDRNIIKEILLSIKISISNKRTAR